MSYPALCRDRKGYAMRVAAEITLSAEEHRKLEKWAATRSTSVRLRERARIVLMAAQGMTNKAIAAQLGVDANKVGRWRSRVAKEGMSSIEKERPRGANHGGKNSKKQAELRSRVIEATTQTTPKDATHWSCRSMVRSSHRVSPLTDYGCAFAGVTVGGVSVGAASQIPDSAPVCSASSAPNRLGRILNTLSASTRINPETATPPRPRRSSGALAR